MDTNNSTSLTTSKILNFIKSKGFAVAIVILAGIAILLGVFQAGIAIGYRKAKFSYAWGENYHRNFGGPRDGFMREFNREIDGRDFIGAHGTFGSILSITGRDVIIRGRDGIEKIIVTGDKTEVRRFDTNIKVVDLMADESVVVIGEPNNLGQIEAKFIRVMPPMPTKTPFRILIR